MDVLVTCSPYAPALSSFPQVRGHFLAEHLRRSGLEAGFRQLPLDGVRCEVLICSDYQGELEWFAERLEGPLGEVEAARTFCLAAYSLGGRDHFSTEYCEWFGRRGGVLCHLEDAPPAPYEHVVGLGVDPEAVPPPDGGDGAGRVVFDFPATAGRRTADGFDPRMLDAAREALPRCRVVGTGPADSPIRALFDEWVDYGQPHGRYVAQAYRGAIAFVPGWRESMGLAVAEAQVGGACIVSTAGQIRDAMLCPQADVRFDGGDPASLASALLEAERRDRAAVRAEALDRFDFARVVARTRAAIGL